MADCKIDGRPSSDGTLCPGCLDTLKAELRAVPWLVEQLTITLTRQARVGERTGPRSSEVPLMYHAGASVDLESLRDELFMVAKAVAGARQVTIDAEPEPVALSRWLLRWSGELARHPDAHEFFEGIHSLTRAARRTIDLAPDRRFLGPCDDCGEDLFVWTTPGRLPETVYCATPECGAKYPMKERRAYLLEAAYDRLLTAAEMSRAIQELIPGQSQRITANTISQWASRGLRGQVLTKFLPHPRDPHQRTRYRVEEVIRFARRAVGADDDEEASR